MPGDLPTTSSHRGPLKPEESRRRPALVCAFPRALAFPLSSGGVSIGRAWFGQHGLVDAEVSSEHLRIELVRGQCEVSDAGSRNGTWVNGSRLSARDVTPLADGAVLRVGRTLFVYREHLRGASDPSPPLGGLVGAYGLRAVAEGIEALSRGRPNNVLVEGETGVGKELVAREVARVLGRDKPFAALNVAGIASGVFEAQMFGHVAGAFSDARHAAPGILAAHQGGTVFLDEIGDLDLESQVKLLRLLENREILPVGAARPLNVDVLLVAATNRNIDDLVEQGRFRRDLSARFAKARIHVPALRERPEDVFELAVVLSQRDGIALASEQVEVEAIERLMLEDWPNNVRELDAALAAARRCDADPGLRLWALEEVLGKAPATRSALTEQTVEAALNAAGGNLSAAAQSLGVSRGKLLRFRKRGGH